MLQPISHHHDHKFPRVPLTSQ
uniref:Uncharacterized protein n=1 Tax=Anguilla anguilla TaxID=7936 RepID=A0A0E9SR09_ANGAN